MAPFDQGEMCDYVNKSWALLCHGLHKWTPRCDQRAVCEGGKWTELVAPEAVGAVDLGLNTNTGHLNAKSQKAIARASPTLVPKGPWLQYTPYGGGLQVTTGPMTKFDTTFTSSEVMSQESTYTHYELFGSDNSLSDSD